MRFSISTPKLCSLNRIYNICLGYAVVNISNFLNLECFIFAYKGCTSKPKFNWTVSRYSRKKNQPFLPNESSHCTVHLLVMIGNDIAKHIGTILRVQTPHRKHHMSPFPSSSVFLSIAICFSVNGFVSVETSVYQLVLH